MDDVLRPGASQELLAAIVEGSDDAIFAKSLTGEILSWNRGAERIYGYTPDDIVGRPVTTLVPPDIENDVPAIMERLARGERIDQYETTRRAKDGRRLRVSLTISPIHDERGKVVGASVIARDITAAKRAERRRALLLELGETLSSVLAGDELMRILARRVVGGGLADYCVAYLYEPPRIRRVGVAHADPADEPIVRRLVDLDPPTVSDELGAGAVVRTGEPILVPEIDPEVLDRVGRSEAYRALLRDLAPISSMVLPLRARGRVIGALALASTERSGNRYSETDLAFARELADRAALALDNARLYEESRAEVEGRRQAEEALQRRYEQLRTIYRMTEAVTRSDTLDAIYREGIDALLTALGEQRASILLFDPDGVIRFKAWRGISEGYRRAVEGHTPWTEDTRNPDPIVMPDVAEAEGLDESLRQTLLGEGIRGAAFIPLVFQDRLLGKFMIYLAEPRRLADDDIELAQSVASTIAFAITRVRDEQRVRAAKEEAERASQAKSQFLGVMSHELRTPLNTVMGYADLLLMEAKGPLNETQRQFARRIQTSAQHQLSLVEELLTYTRIEAGREEIRLVSTDVARLVRDVAEFVRPAAERKNLELAVDLPEGTLQGVTDPARLRQIVLNLAGNAVKFTAEGRVALRAARNGDDKVQIVVSDTGPGIPEEQRERIWEPFVQAEEGTRRPAEGTGLGLTIVRRLTELLGGSVRMESTEGEGTTFYVTVPIEPV